MTRAAAAFLFGLLCVASPSAQQQQQQPTVKPQDPQQPTFRTEANFVRVDVYATKQGRPIRDLNMEDFEVFEEGVAQKVTTFEYVEVRTGAPQEQRQEPNTLRESQDALRNPRGRVFVLFLDVPHVTIDGAWHSREPLIRMLDNLMGPDDVVGIMTPKMAPTDITFARKTQVIAGGLRDRWPWGERGTLAEDQDEAFYAMCFPDPNQRDVVEEMKVRRRERMTLETMRDLVMWLREQREERKAILTISEGWVLFRPNSDLTRLRVLLSGEREPIPGAQPVGVGPDGRLRLGQRDTNVPMSLNDCWSARNTLSMIDNDRLFKDVIELANRANATFYSVDPRGLPVFDTPVGPKAPPPPHLDAAILKHRTDNLVVLANNTDGFAVMNNNDLNPGLKRIADDLTSYYLLGYYSSNTKLDGRFRQLKVRIKRPDVDVRARRGYRAATAAEVEAIRKAASAPPPAAEAVAATAALGALARLRPEAKLHTQAIALEGPVATVWFSGELTKPLTAATTASVTISAGSETESVEVAMAAGQRSFTGSATLKSSPASVDVRVRIAPAGEIPYTDTANVDVVSGLPLPLMFRRGPSTANRYEPAGQPQFSRTERVRFDVRATPGSSVTEVRILDRNANPIEVPISRTERDGWMSAEVTLAALAPGDYLVEFTGKTAAGAQKVLAAFRVTR
jgi:VWFA-related protein